MTQPKSKAAQERMQEGTRGGQSLNPVSSGQLPISRNSFKSTATKLDHQLNVWKDRNEIFSIDGGAEDELFPKFAFDRNRDLNLFDAIPRILQIFGNKLSRLAIASWFIADCSYLDDQPPKDVLQGDPDWVIDAARDEMEEVSHG